MQTRSLSSASTELVPFVKSPAGHSREAQLQIVGPTSSRGKLLPAWTVLNRPRSSSDGSKGSVDTYFIEPGTGREFTSVESVQRHLARTGHFFNENTRVYEGSRTKQDHRSLVHASKGFRLPRGWIVEEFPRRNSSHIDKYYVERKTGKRFRSLVSVERYLKGPENGTDQQLMLLQYHRGHSKDFTLRYHPDRSKDFSLPDGWIVEAKPRRSSSHIDKSYIEPGTGKRFRSLAAVERYLNSTVDLVNSRVHSGQLSFLPNGIGFQTVVIDPDPPKKVKWVLTGPGGNKFSAHVKGSDVSSSVKQAWSEAFVSLIQDRF